MIRRLSLRASSYMGGKTSMLKIVTTKQYLDVLTYVHVKYKSTYSETQMPSHTVKDRCIHTMKYKTLTFTHLYTCTMSVHTHTTHMHTTHTHTHTHTHTRTQRFRPLLGTNNTLRISLLLQRVKQLYLQNRMVIRLGWINGRHFSWLAHSRRVTTQQC